MLPSRKWYITFSDNKGLIIFSDKSVMDVIVRACDETNHVIDQVLAVGCVSLTAEDHKHIQVGLFDA